MKTIHNKKVADLLNSWLDKNHTSIKKAAEKLNVAQTALWRQLKGSDPIPLNRLQEMISLWAPSDIEMEKMNVLLSGEEEQPDVSEQAEEQADEQEEETAPGRKPGEIVYYGTWGSIGRGIFCGHPADDALSIIFPLYPKMLVLDAKCDRGDSTVPHEFFACTLERNENLFTTPEALMEHETAAVRAHMEKQIETMNQDA
jgi:hypothetical protein